MLHLRSLGACTHRVAAAAHTFPSLQHPSFAAASSYRSLVRPSHLIPSSASAARLHVHAFRNAIGDEQGETEVVGENDESMYQAAMGERSDTYEADDDDGATGISTAKEAKKAARELTGGMTKADRLALNMKRKRAAKAAGEAAKHSKERVEKMKEKARKFAAQKAQSGETSDETNFEGEGEATAEETGVELGSLDKAAEKALNAKLAASAPKAAAGAKLSPAQIAAAAATASKAKAAMLVEQSIVRINEKVSSDRILLIGEDGKSTPMSRAEGVKLARAQKLDLFQVSPAHRKDAPAVCKILNYKFHRMQQERKEKEDAKARRAQNKEVKTVQFKGKIASGDLLVKIERAQKFLQHFHPVKIQFVSRQPDAAIFLPLFEIVIKKLLLDGSVEPGSLSETKPYLHVSPLSEKKRQLLYPKLTPEQQKEFGVYVTPDGVWKQRGRIEHDENKEVDEKDEDDDEDDDAEEASAKSAAAPAAPAQVTPAAAAPAAPEPAAKKDHKEEKRKKQKTTYTSGPQLFSRAALQNLKKEQGEQ